MKQRRKLIPVTLELGGKSPVIVDDTANIKVAVNVLVLVNLLIWSNMCRSRLYISSAES